MHQAWIYVLGALVALSGGLWLVFHTFISIAGEFGPAAHPLERWWLRLHGLSAAAFLILFGTVLPAHARIAWHARRNRFSGALFFGVLTFLIASGYALYYVGHEATRSTLSIGHWAVGLAAPAFIVWHAWRGLLSRRNGGGSAGNQDRA
jgi:hypothetical protein